jgi:hypothetical protein
MAGGQAEGLFAAFPEAAAGKPAAEFDLGQGAADVTGEGGEGVLAVSGALAGGGEAAAEVPAGRADPGGTGCGGACGLAGHGGSGSGGDLDAAGIFRVEAARAVHAVRGTVNAGGGYVRGAHDDGLITMPGRRGAAGISAVLARGGGALVAMPFTAIPGRGGGEAEAPPELGQVAAGHSRAGRDTQPGRVCWWFPR